LFNVLTMQLICPCHQSTFNVLQDAKPVFGPASRPLPQLPLGVTGDGYLVALSDFVEPVGPGFWNRAGD
jgi:ubiquinol-cytochrome c reductase iron-sulfur subunit